MSSFVLTSKTAFQTLIIVIALLLVCTWSQPTHARLGGEDVGSLGGGLASPDGSNAGQDAGVSEADVGLDAFGGAGPDIGRADPDPVGGGVTGGNGEVGPGGGSDSDGNVGDGSPDDYGGGADYAEGVTQRNGDDNGRINDDRSVFAGVWSSMSGTVTGAISGFTQVATTVAKTAASTVSNIFSGETNSDSALNSYTTLPQVTDYESAATDTTESDVDDVVTVTADPIDVDDNQAEATEAVVDASQSDTTSDAGSVVSTVTQTPTVTTPPEERVSIVIDNAQFNDNTKDGCVIIRETGSSFSRCIGSNYTLDSATAYCEQYAAQNPDVEFSCTLDQSDGADELIGMFGSASTQSESSSSDINIDSDSGDSGAQTATLEIIFQGASYQSDVAKSFSGLTWAEALALCNDYEDANRGIRQDCLWAGERIGANGVLGTPYPTQGIVDPDTGEVWEGTGNGVSEDPQVADDPNEEIEAVSQALSDDSESADSSSGTYSAWIINEGVTITSQSNVTQTYAKNHCQSNAAAWQQQYKSSYPSGAIKCIWQGEGASTWTDGVSIASDSGETVQSSRVDPGNYIDTSGSCVAGYFGSERLDPNGPYNHLCGTGVMGEVRYYQRQSRRQLGDGTCSVRWITVRSEYNCGSGWSSSP